MKRPFLALAVPLLALLGWAMLPLVRGGETLFLRDVANAHLEMKVAQNAALARGFFPELDPFRAGGQPLAGNPNGVPFYPDNLLYRAAPPIWAFNAHFWLHLLLAPFAFAWLARAWGLPRGAAWVAAACYAVSGFFLSHLSFYNLIAGATLAPALAAACLAWAGSRRGGGAGGSGRRGSWLMPALAVLAALLLLGGDPLMAALALGLGLSAMAFQAAAGALAARASRRAAASAEAIASAPDAPGAPGAALAPASPPVLALPAASTASWPPLWRSLGWFFASLGVGAFLAAPQLVELARILPLSFRGHWGYTPEVATVASWDPRQAVEWLLPFLFGRPDVVGPGSFWGSRFFTDVPPYYLSLYPGVLALALAAAAGLPRRRRAAALWAWGSIAAGLFVSLGRFNPLAARLFDLPGAGALRYPVKLWLPVAVGAALLCGIGFERVCGEADAVDTAARRRFAFTLGGLAGIFAAGWVSLTLLPGVTLPALRRLVPAAYPDAFVANERLRWAGLCLVSLALVAALALAARLMLRRQAAGRSIAGAAALLLALHIAAQLLLLKPLFPTDAVYPYLVPPPALDLLPPAETIVNGSSGRLFGPSRLELGNFPAPQTRWLERRAFYELYPASGPLWGRRFELDVSPEGLDSFLTRMAEGAVKHSGDDLLRVRLLAAWGVGRLLLDRPLDPRATAAGAVPGPRARLLGTFPSFGDTLHVYAVDGRAPALYLARRALPAPHLNAAYALLTAAEFRPGEDVVVAGGGPPRQLAGGRLLALRRGPESLAAEVDAAGPGYLVVDRAHLPLYRASVDGNAAQVSIANLDRLAIALPAGRHHVRLWVDRRPLAAGAAASLLGLLGLGWLADRAARPRRLAGRAAR